MHQNFSIDMGVLTPISALLGQSPKETVRYALALLSHLQKQEVAGLVVGYGGPEASDPFIEITGLLAGVKKYPADAEQVNDVPQT